MFWKKEPPPTVAKPAVPVRRPAVIVLTDDGDCISFADCASLEVRTDGALLLRDANRWHIAAFAPGRWQRIEKGPVPDLDGEPA